MLRKRERMEFLLLHVLELCDATIKILQVLWPTYPFGIKPFLNLVGMVLLMVSAWPLHCGYLGVDLVSRIFHFSHKASNLVELN